MIPFYPPQVQYRRPKVSTVLAFLKSQGWTLEGQDKRFYRMKPPEETRSEDEGGFVFHVPANEDAYSYDQAAHLMVETFAEIFEIPLQALFDLLSKSLDEIKEQVAPTSQIFKMQKAMLVHES